MPIIKTIVNLYFCLIRMHGKGNLLSFIRSPQKLIFFFYISGMK